MLSISNIVPVMHSTKIPYFVDLFTGCGGLSLGLMEAGWRGLFAIEQARDAFKSLEHNLINKNAHNKHKVRFEWPGWLEKKPFEIKEFVSTYLVQLKELRGHVQLVAGGPPCQGFSFAGKRSKEDPRNELFKYHLEIVDILAPEFVLMENVQGIGIAHGASKRDRKNFRGRPPKSYASRISEMLESHGFIVQQQLAKAIDFGVPQFRPRYFTIGIRTDLLRKKAPPHFFEILNGIRRNFLHKHGLPVNRPVTIYEAISDLETVEKKIVPCNDKESLPGFKEILYSGPDSRFQKLMHFGANCDSPNSLRLVNHRPKTIQKFRKIIKTCRKGVELSDNDRARLGINKLTVVPLAADRPSHTLTTLPDDFLHYSEPRILTVREYARLQSFPDWFEFLGKYTTGGEKRARECPRYTQVGNAVPPLLAKAIGTAFLIMRKELLTRENSDNLNTIPEL